MRADVFLVERGIAASRQKAKVMIEEGIVYADGKQVIKPSAELNDVSIEIRGEIMPYVSRGGLKLKAALDGFGIDVAGMVCLDVGASTGGFTDCLLRHGAARVYAVDCGHDQLASSLCNDPRVISIEGCNARDISPCIINESIDVCVMDVSFISQTLIHPALVSVIKKGAVYLSLIKPQFEAGRSNIGKNGIVKSEKARNEAIQRVVASAEACGFTFIDKIISPITGGDGNIEYIGFFKYEGSSDT